ncbi:MAG TPA: FGGY family carbohydrate kinase [Candidatus Limnocylindria bacterium]|nr:FGGY family carbohydrate kinase [Candidatus Limnocylindria bacterium]
MPRRTPFEVSPSAAERPLALAIDVGSSSVRAMLFDRLGRPLHGLSATAAYRMRTSPGGAVEVPADELVEHLAGVLDRLALRAGRRLREVAAVGTCTFSQSLVALDGDGRPLTGVLSWADTTAKTAADELRAELDQAHVWQRTGAPLHASYWPARLRLLGRRGVACWTGFGELLGEWLTGRQAASVSSASATGMLERRRDRWDEQLLGHLGVAPASLPPIVADDQPLGTLRPALARRWPALAGVPWYPAWTDAACGNVGLGCHGPNRAALMIGTSSALRVLLDGRDVDVPSGLFCFRLGSNGSLLGGQLSEGGGTMAWLARLTHRSLRWLERAAAELPADAHGLTVLPYLAGERGPGYHDRARAAISGLSLNSGPAEVFRATLEAVALRLAAIDGRLTSRLADPPQVVAGGGGVASSAIWPQILADALGRAILLPEGAAQPSARGAALLALLYSGAAPLDEAAPVRGRLVPADAERHALYRAALARQEALYESFSEGWSAG